MQPTPGSSDCQIHFCCPLPDITVGQTITTDPGTDAQVRVTPTPCGAQLDFSIPRGETGTAGPSGPDIYASFVTLMVPLPDGSPIPFATGTADATGHIVQTSGTQITLLPGTYLVTYHISAILLTAGYLQITPAYQGRGFLEYGVYSRTAENNASVSGSASFILTAPEETVLTLNSNSNAVAREGAMTMVILKLHSSAEN